VKVFKGTTKRKGQAALFVLAPMFMYLILNRYWMAEDGKSAILIYELFMLGYLLGAAIFCFRFAVRVHRSKQYPLPGAEMPFTTKAQTGKPALMQAYALFFLAILLPLYGLYKYGLNILNY
jgi:hypothetical protein